LTIAVLYLLDADTIITGDRKSYPLKRFPVFWRWLLHMGQAGVVKIPLEQLEEITQGHGPIVDWLNEASVRDSLLLDEELDGSHVNTVTIRAYGRLNDVEIEEVGRDPFLVAYAALVPGARMVVTFEVSAPGQKKGRKKLPDACIPNGVPTCNLFQMIDALDFTTDWKP